MEFKLIGKNVPSSKNSKVLTKQGRIIPSKLTREYEVWALPILEELKEQFISAKNEVNETPLKIGFYLYRDSRRRYDFINVVQVLADLFVKVGYIEDDDTKHFIPIYQGEEIATKENSGVRFSIIKTI